MENVTCMVCGLYKMSNIKKELEKLKNNPCPNCKSKNWVEESNLTIKVKNGI